RRRRMRWRSAQKRKPGRKESCGNGGAVESVGKPKAGFPLFPQPLGNLAKDRRDSHISTAPATRRMEKWKTKNRFPTFPPPSLSRKTKTPEPGGLRPPPGGGRFAPPKSQRVIVVDREK